MESSTQAIHSDSSNDTNPSLFSEKIKKIKEFILHPRIFRHGKNMGWMLFVRIAGMVISFFTTAYTARYLGPSNFGELSYAISFVGIFGFIATLGIDQVLYREFIAYPEKRNEYLGTAIILRIGSAIAAILLCIAGGLLLTNQNISVILILLISGAYIFSPFQLINFEFQADAQAKYPSIVFLWVTILLNIFKILIVVFHEGIIFLALVILIEPILYAIGLLYYRVKVYGSISKWKYDSKVAMQILKDSFPLIFASAFFAIYARIDQVMLKSMLSTESVGLYDAAVRLSEVGYFIPNIILGSIFPALMNSKKTSFELFAKRAKKIFFLLLLVSGALSLCIASFAHLLVFTVFGAGFTASVMVLQIYVWSNIGTAINLISQQLLISENHTGAVSSGIFFGAILNVILNIFLIPRYGMSGAAFASLVSYFVPFVSFFIFKKSRKFILQIISEKDESGK